MKILIVDDDIISRTLLRSILEDNRSDTIEEAEDGHSAWRILEGPQLPDLVISDVNMPGMDGLELMEKIRGSDHCRSMKIMLITSQKDRDTLVKAAHLDVAAYILKPYDASNVLAKIEQVKHLKHSASAAILITPKIIMDRLAISYERYLQLISLLIDDIEKNLIFFESVCIQNTISLHFARYDAMKGACLNLGADSFLKAADRVKGNLFSGNSNAALASIKLLKHEMECIKKAYQKFLSKEPSQVAPS